MNPFETVYDKLGAPEVLTQLAQDAAELAQAALKLRRALVKTNPTPKGVGEAMADLYEEIADVQNSLSVLDASGQLDKGDIERLRKFKMDRWVKELGGTV